MTTSIRFALRIFAAWVTLLPAASPALEDFAEITQVVSHAKVSDPASGDSAASVSKPVKCFDRIATESNSRIELIMPDESVVRLGANSVLITGQNSHDMTLQQGTMLVQVPPHAGGKDVRMGNITVTVKGGTLMTETKQGQPTKLIALTGSSRVRLNNKHAESMLLEPGQMLILPPGMASLSNAAAVPVNVMRITQTSRLINGMKNTGGAGLNLQPVTKEIAAQRNAILQNELTLTNLVMLGSSFDAILTQAGLIQNQTSQQLTLVIPGQSAPLTAASFGLFDDSELQSLLSLSPPIAGYPKSVLGPVPSNNLDITVDPTVSISTFPPNITVGGANYKGNIFRSISQDGRLSDFLFGTTTAFDTTTFFNSFQNVSYLPLAGFKFQNLTLSGNPTFNTTGSLAPVSLALVTTGSITSGGTGGAIDFSGYDGTNKKFSPQQLVLLAAQNGSVDLNAPLTSVTAENLGVVARGPNGNVNINVPINVNPDYGTFYVDGENSIGIHSTVNAANVNIQAQNNVDLTGAVFNSTASFGFFSFSAGTLGQTYNGTLNLGGAYFSVPELTFTVFPNLSFDASQFDFAKLNFLSLATTNLTLTGNFDFSGTITGGGYGAHLFLTNLTSAGNLTGVTEISAFGDVTAPVIGAKYIQAANLTAQTFVPFVAVPPFVTAAPSDFQNAPATTDRYDVGNIFGNIQFGGATESIRNLAAPGNSLILNATSQVDDNTFTSTGGSLAFGPSGIASADFSGGDALASGSNPAGDGGSLTATAAGDINVSAPITATTGRTSVGRPVSGAGGTVNLTGDTVEIGSTIQVSSNDPASPTGGTRRSNSGGNINITSTHTDPTVTSIHITNTAQLLSLLNSAATGPGGMIQVTSAGGAITVDGGNIQADHGTVKIVNNLATGGNINLNSGTISADVIKAGAIGTNGVLTISAGMNLSAVKLLQLYGGNGALGEVLFTGAGTVYLAGNPIHIGATTVQINSSTTVQNKGPTFVHATNHNYNGNGNGSFTNPVTKTGVSGRPAF